MHPNHAHRLLGVRHPLVHRQRDNKRSVPSGNRGNRGYSFRYPVLRLHSLVIHPLIPTDMAKRRSKTVEQQCRYYEVGNIFEYMVDTYLNGNMSMAGSASMTGSEMPKVPYSVSRLLAVGWLAARLSNCWDEGIKPSFFICSNTGRLSCISPSTLSSGKSNFSPVHPVGGSGCWIVLSSTFSPQITFWGFPSITTVTSRISSCVIALQISSRKWLKSA